MGGRGSLWARWLWLVLARHGQSWLVVSWIRSVGFDRLDSMVARLALMVVGLV